jgi:hypothetical protein
LEYHRRESLKTFVRDYSKYGTRTLERLVYEFRKSFFLVGKEKLKSRAEAAACIGKMMVTVVTRKKGTRHIR